MTDTTATVAGGIRLVESSRPAATAKRLARKLDAQVCEGLAAGLASLTELQVAHEHVALVARAERAIALAARLQGFDEETDRALVERSDELIEAQGLDADAPDALSELATLARAFDEAAHRTRRLEEALERALGSFDHVPGATAWAVEAARDHLLAAESAVALATVEVEHLRAREHDLSDARSSTTSAEAEVVGAQRALEYDGRESRRMTARAGVVGGLGVAGLVASVAGAIPRILGGVALAFMPPAVEFARRARALRVAAETRLRGAEMRVSLATQEILGEAAVGRRDRVRAERRLADATRVAVAARVAWVEVAGADVDPASAGELIDALVDVEDRRRELAAAHTVEEERRQELTERFVAIGFVPDADDLSGSMHRLRRLLAIQSEASELLAAAAAAERRMVAREALAGLVGTLDLTAMERALEEPAPTPARPLVIIDDEDDDALPELQAMLGTLPGSAHVSILTRQVARWQVTQEAAPAPESAPEPEPPEAPPEPKPERPWFAS